MYFKNFPNTDYRQSKNSTNSRNVTNILVSASIRDNFANTGDKAFVDYIIKDEEKPEHIAEKIYGKSDYMWIILLSNQIINPYFDWPKSQRELESYIRKIYSGSAVFVSPIDFQFLRSTSGTSKLSVSDSNFVIGNTVTQQNNSTFTATVKSWDSTLRKVVLTDIEGVLTAGSNADYLVSENMSGESFRVRPHKLVSENAESLHHFEDTYKNIIDPYTHWDTNTVTRGRFNEYSIYDNPDSITLDFPLKSYILNSYEIGSISNKEYEYDENDYKRNIKLLKVEIFGKLVEQLSTIFI